MYVKIKAGASYDWFSIFAIFLLYKWCTETGVPPLDGWRFAAIERDFETLRPEVPWGATSVSVSLTICQHEGWKKTVVKGVLWVMVAWKKTNGAFFFVEFSAGF